MITSWYLIFSWLIYFREVAAENGAAEKVEKEVEKKVVAEEKPEDVEEEAEPKENGDSAKNGDAKETNGGMFLKFSSL